MKLTPEQQERLAALMAVDLQTRDVIALGRIVGLDPAQDFARADWRGCRFGAHDLGSYSFIGADIRGADFSDARRLRPEQFQFALWDASTRFPGTLSSRMRGWREPIRGLPEAGWPEMVTLPSGDFLMGAPEGEEDSDEDERPRRRVTVARPFALGRCAVTFAQWDAAVAAGFVPPAGAERPDDRRWGRDAHPVINVSWDDARAYCVWLNDRLGLREGTYRLPSEAEWEYGCRAGTETAFSFGETITPSQVNYNGNFTPGLGREGTSPRRTVPVGSLPSNGWGLAECHGNVWEWCEDAYGPYPAHPTDSRPLRHEDSDHRVLRGGSWINEPRYCRSASRSRSGPVVRSDDVGFRLARTLF